MLQGNLSLRRPVIFARAGMESSASCDIIRGVSMLGKKIMRGLVALVLVLAGALAMAAAASYYDWNRNWKAEGDSRGWGAYNALLLLCVVAGVWENGGPNWDRYLDSVDSPSTPGGERGRNIALFSGFNLPPPDPCSPTDEKQYWDKVQKIADERDWAEANFLLALQFGHGSFYNEKEFLLSDNGAVSVRKDLGDGKSLDLQKSFALLSRSAEQGYYVAQRVLAEAHLTGEWGKDGAMQVDINPELAMEWLRKAAAQGDEGAKTRLEQLVPSQAE